MTDTKTLSYYENSAEAYSEATLNFDMSASRNGFLRYLKNKAKILDFGCGSGRDSIAFLECGYLVDACDGSAEMVKHASENTRIQVKQMLFSELNSENVYDGIWACASILHCSKTELEDVFCRMITALKRDGVIYTSFKYGTYEGWIGDRYFTFFTEEDFVNFISVFTELEMLDIWRSGDSDPSRRDLRWLNVILRKK